MRKYELMTIYPLEEDKYKAGLEALKAIIGKHPEAKIVMWSAMGQEAMVIEAIKLGAKDFIVKPFKPDRILKTVSSILPQA